MLRLYRFPIKGSYYYSADLAYQQDLLKVGNLLYLVPEPDNAHDSHALQIWSSTNPEQGYLIGYVPRQLAYLWQPMFPLNPNYPVTLSRSLAKGKQLRLECDIALNVHWLKHLHILSWSLWLRQQHTLHSWLHSLFHR